MTYPKKGRKKLFLGIFKISKLCYTYEVASLSVMDITQDSGS